jgi:hypothetical protein
MEFLSERAPAQTTAQTQLHKDIRQVLYESVGTYEDAQDFMKDTQLVDLIKDIVNTSLEEVGFYYPHKRKSTKNISPRFKIPYFIMDKIRKRPNSKHWRRICQILKGGRYFSKDEPNKITMTAKNMTVKELTYLINGSVGLY